MTARDKLDKDTGVSMRLEEDGNKAENEYMIAALYGDAVFYSEGLIEDDRMENQDAYVVLDDDCREEMKKKRKESIRKCQKMV